MEAVQTASTTLDAVMPTVADRTDDLKPRTSTTAPSGSSTRTEPPLLTPEQTKAALIQAKDAHSLVIEWVRSFDFKIGPILTAAGALFAGSLTVLGLIRTQQSSLMAPCPITQLLLAITLVPLIYSFVMGVSVVSPSLKWGHWGKRRHLPHLSKTGPSSVVFFGQIALFPDEGAYAKAAKVKFADDVALLDDILNQTYINAKVATNKSQHIAMSARGLFLSVVLLLSAGATFLLKW